MMVGRELTHRFPEKTNTPKDVILEVKNLTALNQPSITDISFDLRAGEILGVAGLVAHAVPTSLKPFLVCVNAAKATFNFTAAR